MSPPHAAHRALRRAAALPLALAALLVAYHMTASAASTAAAPAAPSRLQRRLRGPAAVAALTRQDPAQPPGPQPQPALAPQQPSHPASPHTLLAFARRAALPLFLFYVALFAVFATSQRAQAMLIYLHWLKPPALYPLNDLRPYKLAAVGRNVRAAHLRGWHLVPPGPPFAPTATGPTAASAASAASDAAGSEPDAAAELLRSDSAASLSSGGTADADAARDAFFEQRLAAPAQTVVLFLHGNSGTRACPGKRVDAIKLLNAQLDAHVVTFDYSGFGDSPGRPHEAGLAADARAMLHWILSRVAADSTVLVYGQSLGSFAAVDAVRGAPAVASSGANESETTRGPDALVLDAAPASLVAAALTHPVALAFRVLPRHRMERLFRAMLNERLDSTEKIADVHVPILVLHGKRDAMISVEQARVLARSARDAGNAHVEMHEFEDCGHVDVSSAPAYLTVLHDFVNRVRRTKA